MKALAVRAVGTLATWLLIVPDPPLALKVTVRMGRVVHWAYRVWLEAVLTMVAAVTWVPPEAAVNPPGKGYPVRLVVASVAVGGVKRHHLAGWSGCAAVIGIEGDGVGLGRPLGVQGDVRREGVGRAVGVVRAAAVGGRGPVNEAVASPREGIGRQSRRDVGNLVAHRARATVGVEGHGVVGQSCPLGVQGDVRREGVDRAVGVVCATAVGGRGPVHEAVASPREGIGRQSRRDVGNLVAHRARATVGVEGHGVVRQGCPLGIEGVVGGCAYDGGRSYLGSTGSRREPPRKGVACAAGCGQRTVGGVIRHYLAGWCGCAAIIGIEGDGVGVGRPLGVEGDVRREGVGRAVGVVRAAAVGSRGPVNEAVASPREGVGSERGRDVGNLVAHRA